MGPSNSKGGSSQVNSEKIYTSDSLEQIINQFPTKNIDRRQFVQFLFQKLDNTPHPKLGRIIVSNTFLLQQFFLTFTNNNKNGTVTTQRIKDRILKMYKNPQKAIEYSFQMLDLNQDKKITKGQFLAFIDNCFISLTFAIQKQLSNEDEFKTNFKTWIKSNKMKFLQGVLKVFERNARSNPQYWLMGDYKRWIMQKQNWSLDIDIGVQKLRLPLNLLCLFNLQI